MPSSLSRRAAALALTAAFSLPAAAAVSSTVTTPQAHAQLGSSDTSSRIAYDGSSEPMAEWSKDPAVQGHVLDVIQFFQNDTPWHQLPMWNLWGEQTPYTIDKEQDFAQPRLINREPDERFDVERLYVESPAMRRVVQVQVQYPKDRETAAPMLYLLDGVSAPRQSGWLRKGDVQGTMANEHVTTIMPVEAGGTNYTDWNDTDPYLGRAKWETFLTQELPGVLEQQTGILLTASVISAACPWVVPRRSAWPTCTRSCIPAPSRFLGAIRRPAPQDVPISTWPRASWAATRT